MRALAALLLGACCPAAIVGEDVPPPEGADEALEIIHGEYMVAFDSPRREVSVNWVSSLKVDGDETVYGFAASCADIWLEARARPSASGLAHEVAHCYAAHMPESGCGVTYDNDHSELWLWGDPSDPGDGFVGALNGRLADMGL